MTASTYDPSSNDLPVNEIVLEKVKAEIFLHPYRKQKDLIETEITLTINEGKERKKTKKQKNKKTKKQNINLSFFFFFFLSSSFTVTIEDKTSKNAIYPTVLWKDGSPDDCVNVRIVIPPKKYGIQSGCQKTGFFWDAPQQVELKIKNIILINHKRWTGKTFKRDNVATIKTRTFFCSLQY